MRKIVKTINLDNVEQIDVLTKSELKHIKGGSSACCYSSQWTDNKTKSCNNPSDCESAAGPEGWWCCSYNGACGS